MLTQYLLAGFERFSQPQISVCIQYSTMELKNCFYWKRKDTEIIRKLPNENVK